MNWTPRPIDGFVFCRLVFSLFALALLIQSGCTSSSSNYPDPPEKAAPGNTNRLDVDLPLEEDPELLPVVQLIEPWGGTVRRYKVNPTSPGTVGGSSEEAAVTDSEPSTYVEVNLQGADVNASELAELAQQPGFQKVTSIILRDSQLTDESLRHVAKAEQLQMIDLSNTRITDRGLEYLKGHKSLSYIMFDGSSISIPAADDLLRSLPALKEKW